MIIAFSGKKGCGKSFFAKYLIEKHNFIELSFASSLKKGIQEMFKLTNEDVNDPIKKEQKIERFNITPREIMQWMGTDIMREEFNKKFGYNGSIWVDNVKYEIEELRKNDKDVDIVISDVRFQNEIDMIHSYGGIVINLIGGEVKQYGEHKSENQELTFDYQFTNDKSLTITNSIYDKLDNICL